MFTMGAVAMLMPLVLAPTMTQTPSLSIMRRTALTASSLRVCVS